MALLRRREGLAVGLSGHILLPLPDSQSRAQPATLILGAGFQVLSARAWPPRTHSQTRIQGPASWGRFLQDARARLFLRHTRLTPMAGRQRFPSLRAPAVNGVMGTSALSSMPGTQGHTRDTRSSQEGQTDRSSHLPSGASAERQKTTHLHTH